MLVISPLPAFAQSQPVEEIMEATVTDIIQQDANTKIDSGVISQRVKVTVTQGSMKGESIEVDSGVMQLVNKQQYQRGDKVLVTRIDNSRGESIFYISDYQRRNPLYLLFGIFFFLTVLITRLRGLGSILGMGVSFAAIFFVILPAILNGYDPVTVVLLTSLVIVPISFFLSHGINRKSSIALLGTIISLAITGLLATVFVNLSQLTGYASEEASFLQVAREGTANIKGILLAGIMIGVLGILDDITVTQAGIVYQLKDANAKLSKWELYKRAMEVGGDHITSVVNTLVLVYTGASMPLLLLFIDNPVPFSTVINYEIIADEIVRTLVGSIGLVLAVPITTFLASLIEARSK
jgi:uncharacterized membrane protein